MYYFFLKKSKISNITIFRYHSVYIRSMTTLCVCIKTDILRYLMDKSIKVYLLYNLRISNQDKCEYLYSHTSV